MTREEALQLVGNDDLEELEDAFEDLFFEHKKYFLTKVPVRKLLESRYKKLIDLEKAVTLLGMSIDNAPVFANVSFQTDALILETYRSFQQAKNQLKAQIANATSIQSLISSVDNLLENELIYAKMWYHESVEITPDILVSKEVDPMELLHGIQQYKLQNGTTFEQLKNLENNPPEILIQEMKRLSLLFKKYR